jgi:hypothetical protein
MRPQDYTGSSIRVPVDHPTIDHRERLRDRARKNRAAPSAIFFQKTESDFAALGRRRAFPHGRTMDRVSLE